MKFSDCTVPVIVKSLVKLSADCLGVLNLSSACSVQFCGRNPHCHRRASVH